MRSRFLSGPAQLRSTLAAAQDRGLFIVDNISGPDSAIAELAPTLHLHAAFNDQFINKPPTREQITARLAKLKTITHWRGYAVETVISYSMSIKISRNWVNELAARVFTLAPVGAVAGVPVG